jgi:hypothetical protein
MGTYIDKIVKRFGLEDSRKFTTPMEPGFALTVEDFAYFLFLQEQINDIIIEEPTESMITEMRSVIRTIRYYSSAVRYQSRSQRA